MFRIGKPFSLPPIDRKNRDEGLQNNTDEIMCQIAALLPPDLRGVYANYPRVHELTLDQINYLDQSTQPKPAPDCLLVRRL